jgi:hypothetical protein
MGLSYPFHFACDACGAEVSVTRAEARDLWPDPDSHDAVEVALEQEHGWTNGAWGVWCPDCEPGPSPEPGA